MKKAVWFTLIIMTLGAAYAQSPLSFRFDDQDFTYFGSEAGYLSLSLEDDTLVVHLSDQPTGMRIRFNKIATASCAKMNGSGPENCNEAEYRRDPVKRLALAKLTNCEVARSRAILGHENTSLSNAVAMYSEALALLGFKPETAITFRGTGRDYVFTRGEQRLQVSFSQGIDHGDMLVKVRMQAV